jgi:uncharacterized protein YjbI with pentapeptide repeats
VALPFTASSDFAFDKDAGTPCRHLLPEHGFRCGIHAGLRDAGLSGCSVFDCFGAGQKVTRRTFADLGRHDWHDWREADGCSAQQMFDVFDVMRRLHELLWYLTDALSRPEARPLHADLTAAQAEVEHLTAGTPEELTALDVPALRAGINELLLRTGELVRAQAPGHRSRHHRGADLVGARLRGADLRGADLRSAFLLGADLRNADLRWSELIGADLRGADLRGSDLTDSVFLTRPQVAAARTDDATKLPARLARQARPR